MYGIDEEVFLSLPCVLNSSGVSSVVNMSLTEEEVSQLRKSADTLWTIQKDLKDIWAPVQHPHCARLSSAAVVSPEHEDENICSDHCVPVFVSPCSPPYCCSSGSGPTSLLLLQLHHVHLWTLGASLLQHINEHKTAALPLFLSPLLCHYISQQTWPTGRAQTCFTPVVTWNQLWKWIKLTLVAILVRVSVIFFCRGSKHQ